jgi:hypothetical protein
VAVTSAERVADWVLACRNEDGGFGAFPGDISAVRPTAWALQTLQSLGVSVRRPDRVAEFMASQQNSDGGFLGRQWGLRWTDLSTLANSHYAVRALRAVQRPVPRPEALCAFVASCERGDGSFFETFDHEKAGLCRETFYALSILNLIDARVAHSAKTVRFLQGMQAEEVRADGGFMLGDVPSWRGVVEQARSRAGSPNSHCDPGTDDTKAIPVSAGYTSATYYAVNALSLLGAEAPDPNAAIDFLCAQQTAGGGFDTGMGDYGAYHDRSEGRMCDTYMALAALQKLIEGGSSEGETRWAEWLETSRIDVDACASWIQACQNPDGGFAWRCDPVSRPSDMEATLHAVRACSVLDIPLPSPREPIPPRREELPSEAEFPLSSAFFQPEQPGQKLYLHRIAAPIRAAEKTDEATALALMRWINRHMAFGMNSRNEAGLIIEDAFGACGPQARALAGLLEAGGIPARFLMVRGHCTCEGRIDGRWCLLDAMFDGAFRDERGQLHSALDIHERHRRGLPDATTFGDWRYESFNVYWPQSDGDVKEIDIGADDTRDSRAAREAYPELTL